MKKITLHDKTFRRTIRHRKIVRRIGALAGELNRRWGGAAEPPVFVSVLSGAFMFTAELLKRIEFPCEVVFVKVSSYEGLASAGEVSLLIGVEGDRIRGREVIVLEDIVETGRTIEAIHSLLAIHEPAGIAFVSLFFKPEAYKKTIPIDHHAMPLPNDFIIGYGLDYDQLGRNLKDVYSLVTK